MELLQQILQPLQGADGGAWLRALGYVLVGLVLVLLAQQLVLQTDLDHLKCPTVLHHPLSVRSVWIFSSVEHCSLLPKVLHSLPFPLQ